MGRNVTFPVCNTTASRTQRVCYMLSFACIGNTVTGSRSWHQNSIGSFLNMLPKHESNSFSCSVCILSYIILYLKDANSFCIDQVFPQLPTFNPFSTKQSSDSLKIQIPLYLFPLNYFSTCLLPLK